jgi:putative tricarboxylic transport membrane protein
VTALLIGVVLGPIFEKYLVRALRISEGDPRIFFSSTTANVLWALLLLSLLYPAFRGWKRRKKAAQT